MDMANPGGSRVVFMMMMRAYGCLILAIACMLTINGVESNDLSGAHHGLAAETIFDVTKFGAKADGLTDNAHGNLLAVSEPSVYPQNAWISVKRVDNLIITGGGTINARGHSLWKFANATAPLPVSLDFQTVKFVKVFNLNFVDSMGFHIRVTKSKGVALWGLKITAPGNSPNTDGVHLSNSTNVRITNSIIETGNNCVSIGDGNHKVLVAKITCGLGHGISVLGKRPEETSLKGITIIDCLIKDTTSGTTIVKSIVPHLIVDSVVFPPAVKPPGSAKTFFLGGAGVRGLEIEGKFINFTAIGVYLEDGAVSSLAVKWKGKSVEELTDSVDFFKDIVTGPFEKFIRVTMILPLTGQQYSEKVVENCIAYWKAVGTYTDAESEATKKFIEVLKNETFPPGASILFTQSPLGSLTISFSKDSSLPEQGNAVIQNKQLSEAILQSIIGEHGVSPAAKKSLATRLSDLLK
ncbi:hypothetical protein RD792_009348 [Penstemon davidsonii]|uniref:Chalcone-flavonone isomerase family protein n=1 Tax=Penstemon davidsonii TaxID=160366 RepID=A0ABR0CYT4_9LAMI|nr:hypothetical protein RD792_009348 [Penstemon davidsonii]